MVDVVSAQCEELERRRGPLLTTQVVRCAARELPGMINILSKRCAKPGRLTVPSFNFCGEARGVRCANHELPDMINVKCARCAEPGCTKQPSYNTPKHVPFGAPQIPCAQFTWRSARPSMRRRQPGMVDVQNAKCEELGCHNPPSPPKMTKRPLRPAECIGHPRRKTHGHPPRTASRRQGGIRSTPGRRIAGFAWRQFLGSTAHRSPDDRGLRCRRRPRSEG